MSSNKEKDNTSFEAAHRMETLLPNHSEDLEGDALTDLDRIVPPARPLAEGTDMDSSNTSWEQVNGSGSGGSYVQCRGVEDEAGGNLTSGSSHTRADATAADMPSPAQVMSLSHEKPDVNLELVADVEKLKKEVENPKPDRELLVVLDAMQTQIATLEEHEKALKDMIDHIAAGEIDDKLYNTIQRVAHVEETLNELPMIPSQQEFEHLKSDMKTLKQLYRERESLQRAKVPKGGPQDNHADPPSTHNEQRYTGNSR